MDPTQLLRSVDLNLLVVLNALFAERHVTRAGKIVGLSQSATSNARERLRVLFGDALLERSRGTMMPTPLAQSLRPQLEQALASIEKVIAPRVDLATLSQTIRWSITDYALALFAPPFMAKLRRSAPGLDLVVTPWAGAAEALAQVADGSLEFVVTVLAQGATGLRWQPALTERLVVAMRHDHPARRRFTFDAWLRYPHIVVSGGGQTGGSLDAMLAAHGKTRAWRWPCPASSL